MDSSSPAKGHGSDTAPGVRVSSMQVRELSEAVEHAGVSALQFIARAGLDPSEVAAQYGWFPLTVFDQLLVAAVELTGDPAFGLHWAERSPLIQFDLAPMLVATAPTLRAAFDSVLQFMPLLATRAEVALEQHGERCIVTCDAMALSEVGLRARTEFALVGLTRLLHAMGARDALQHVDIAYARPAHGDEYGRVFGVPVRFEQPTSSIAFAAEALHRPLAHRNAELHEAMRQRTGDLRQVALGQRTYAEQVEQLIQQTLPSLLTMGDAARLLALSERSLRRRLAEEQASYTQLVDRVQQRLAKELLAPGVKSMKEVAFALGFDSVSGFYRAYRRWTGKSLSEAQSGASKPAR